MRHFYVKAMCYSLFVFLMCIGGEVQGQLPTLDICEISPRLCCILNPAACNNGGGDEDGDCEITNVTVSITDLGNCLYRIRPGGITNRGSCDASTYSYRVIVDGEVKSLNQQADVYLTSGQTYDEICIEVTPDNGNSRLGCTDFTVPVDCDDSSNCNPRVSPRMGELNNCEYRFTARGFHDCSGGQPTYTWDFGDGTGDTGANVTHTYSRDGMYTIKVTMRLGNEEDIATLSVTTDNCILIVVDQCRQIHPFENCNSRELDPVCGCNRQTYMNPCLARKAGLRTWTSGPCGGDPIGGGGDCYGPQRTDYCQNIGREVCGCDGVTYRTACHARNAGIYQTTSGPCGDDDGGDGSDCQGVSTGKNCNLERNEVCGCDGKTYLNPCLAGRAGIQSWMPGPCSNGDGGGDDGGDPRPGGGGDSNCSITVTASSSGGCNARLSASARGSGSCGTLTYFWNFGDGTTGGGKNTGHSYSPGTYTACVSVSGTQGGGATACTTVTCGSSMWIPGERGSNTASNFNTYPNPAKSSLIVTYNLADLDTQGTLTLINAQGQRVRTQQLEAATSEQQLDVADLARGVYFLTIQAEGNILHQTKVLLTE